MSSCRSGSGFSGDKQLKQLLKDKGNCGCLSIGRTCIGFGQFEGPLKGLLIFGFFLFFYNIDEFFGNMVFHGYTAVRDRYWQSIRSDCENGGCLVNPVMIGGKSPLAKSFL
jgi:hypothetical protein